MKGLLSVAAGGPETLVIGDIAEPEPAPDELLVEVAACGLNFPDLLVIEDRYQYRPARPFAPGSEISGTVVRAGADVANWKPGDRLVATMPGSGGLAERAVVKASAAFPLPAGHDFVEAAGLLLTYGTAIHALVDRACLAPGETLLVLGAAGGVGLAAVEIGRLLGARVVAAVSSEAKAEVAREAGAEAVFVYPRDIGDDAARKLLADRFKALCGKDGADVILDPVGGDYARAAFRAIGWKGRYLVVGFPAGIPDFPGNLVLLKGCSVVGVFQGAFGEREPEANARNIAQLLAWWSEGRFRPRVTGVYPLERAAEALKVMQDRQVTGKLVVDLSR